MTDLAKLADEYQRHGERIARAAVFTAKGYQAESAGVAFAANCLTIAAHLRDAAEREAVEKAKETYVRHHYGESMVESLRKAQQRSDEAWEQLERSRLNPAGSFTGSMVYEDAPQPQEQEPPSERTYSLAFGCIGSTCRIGETHNNIGCQERCALVELERKGIIASPAPSQEGPEPNGYKQGDELFAEKDEPEPPLSPPKDTRAPARLRDELEILARDWRYETDFELKAVPGFVDRILDKLIMQAKEVEGNPFIARWLIAVKRGNQ